MGDHSVDASHSRALPRLPPLGVGEPACEEAWTLDPIPLSWKLVDRSICGATRSSFLTSRRLFSPNNSAPLLCVRTSTARGRFVLPSPNISCALVERGLQSCWTRSWVCLQAACSQFPEGVLWARKEEALGDLHLGTVTISELTIPAALFPDLCEYQLGGGEVLVALGTVIQGSQVWPPVMGLYIFPSPWAKRNIGCISFTRGCQATPFTPRGTKRGVSLCSHDTMSMNL